MPVVLAVGGIVVLLDWIDRCARFERMRGLPWLQRPEVWRSGEPAENHLPRHSVESWNRPRLSSLMMRLLFEEARLAASRVEQVRSGKIRSNARRPNNCLVRVRSQSCGVGSRGLVI